MDLLQPLRYRAICQSLPVPCSLVVCLILPYQGLSECKLTKCDEDLLLEALDMDEEDDDNNEKKSFEERWLSTISEHFRPNIYDLDITPYDIPYMPREIVEIYWSQNICREGVEGAQLSIIGLLSNHIYFYLRYEESDCSCFGQALFIPSYDIRGLMKGALSNQDTESFINFQHKLEQSTNLEVQEKKARQEF